MQSVIDKLNEMLGDKGEILYLTEFGSKLYGTNGPNSDIDYKGIFLPSKRELLLGNKCKTIQFTTGDGDTKNTKDDIDAQLYSLQYWLELVKNCDTNAIDLLYSIYSKHNKKLIDKNVLKTFKSTPYKLFNVKESKAYIGYAMGQAKKYGLKGSRLGVIKNLIQWFEEKNFTDEELFEKRLSEYVDEILEKYHTPSLLFVDSVRSKTNEKQDFLFVLGKAFELKIRMSEVKRRIYEIYEKYGERARLAEQNEGVDWKAISHAFRCLYQTNDLADTGFIYYPLKEKNFLIEVKNGKYSWNECEEQLVKLLDSTQKKLDDMKPLTNSQRKEMNDMHEKIILSWYE